MKHNGMNKNSSDMKEQIREEVMKVYDQEASVDEVVDKLLVLFGVRLSFTDEKFRELFNELINAGRDMQIRDNLGNSYMSEDMYFKDVKARYSNDA